MGHPAFGQIRSYSQQPQKIEDSIAYLTRHLSRFVKQGDKILICFPEHRVGEIGWLMEQAVVRCGAVPVLWGPDHRWKTLLQQAFFTRATTIIGPPLIVLGLSKLKKHNGIPLYIRRAVLSGYPSLPWMIEGIMNGLDCTTEGCFCIHGTGAVTGFSCGDGASIHLREDVYGADIVDKMGNPVADGQMGEIVFYPRECPEMRLSMGEDAILDRTVCACGHGASKLTDIRPGRTEESEDLYRLGQYLQSWTSVLDCRLNKGAYGLEIEMVVFPGEKLPKLPTSAKLVIHRWDPKHDEPFPYVPSHRIMNFSLESH